VRAPGPPPAGGLREDACRRPQIRAEQAPGARSFKDKEVQRDAKMVSYKVVDKDTKPYIEVEVAGDKKVRRLMVSPTARAAPVPRRRHPAPLLSREPAPGRSARARAARRRSRRRRSAR